MPSLLRACMQSRAQFSMWAVMASPLLISGSVLRMSNYTLATYANPDVIAVNQDVMGCQGTRVFGGNLTSRGRVGGEASREVVRLSHRLVSLLISLSKRSLISVLCSRRRCSTIVSWPLHKRDLSALAPRYL